MKSTVKNGVLALAVMLAVSGCQKKAAETETAAITVRTAPPVVHTFRDEVKTQGVVEARNSAVLSANVIGKLEVLKVEVGDCVKKGDLLFQSDRENLTNARNFAAETVKVAEERVRTRTADLKIAKLAFNKDELDYNRTKSLYATQAASQTAFENAELKYNRSQLNIEQAEASLDTAKAEVALATSALAIADKLLADSAVYAPYDGVITAKYHEANEFLNPGTPVLRVEAPEAKRVAVTLSAVHFPRVKPGETRVALTAGGQAFVVPVSVVDGAIDAKSRTFEIKADLPPKTAIPTGLLTDTAVIFGERTSSAVPEDAVLFRAANGFQVFVVDADSTAKGIPVSQGITQDGLTETPELAKLNNPAVIVSGQYFVSEKSPVRVLEK